jgi:hypothetical protein
MVSIKPKGVPGASRKILETLSKWNQLQPGPHRFGGIEYRLFNTELGHTHGDHQADIKFTRAKREELVREGLAHPHHIHPETGWITVYIRKEEDIARAILLFRLAYEAVEKRKKPKKAPEKP